MKFVQRDMGEAAEASSGGGTRGTVKEAATLAVLVCLTMAILYFLIGLVTDIAVAGISPQREARLFGAMNPAGVLGETIPEEYEAKWKMAENVLEKLSMYTEVAPLDYRLLFVNSPEPNAFAFPGGGIGVTSGLLDALDEEIPIAFVIGHELGHFAHRDHLKGMGRRVGFTLAVQLVFGGGLDSLTSKGAELMLLKYSRDQEAKADEFGLACLDDLYGNLEGAGRLFEILENESNLPDWAYMFATHPDSELRLRLLSEKWR